MKKSTTRRTALTWGLFAGSCLLAGLGVFVILINFHIQDSVSEYVNMAKRRFSGDRVEAVVAMLEARHTSIREKNWMIWTLGTIGDARALPVLTSLYTGTKCRHGYEVCQYEVEKAIRKIQRESSFGVFRPLLCVVWFASLATMTAAWWWIRKQSHR